MSPQTPWAIDITYLPNLPGFPAPQLHGPRPIWTDLIQHGLRNIVQVSCQPRAKLCPENCRQENWFSPTQVNVSRTYCILGYLKNSPPKRNGQVTTRNATSFSPGVQQTEPSTGLLPLPAPKESEKTNAAVLGAMA